MAFAQPVQNQSSVMKVNLMVVDDDPVFLDIMSRMLEKSKYREPLAMEVTVTPARDSQEALSTLKVQRNNIDLIITDYYMPGMNGLQLKRKITEEFGNLPVIVISSDANKEEESLTSGAVCFIPKPIRPSDLTKIYESALICKKNGKSILWTENNQTETVPQNVQLLPEQAQLLPEQANVLKTTKTKNLASRSVNNKTIGNSSDGSRKHRKRSNGDGDGDDDDEDEAPQPAKKKKITWTDHLHDLFLKAIRHLGLDKAVPKKILEYMNVPYLTRENVASHLQKYRMFLRKVAEQGLQCSNMMLDRETDSVFSHGHIRETPYLNHYTRPSGLYDSSLNNKSFYSNPGYGFGQSRLLCNTREPLRFNQMAPHNYMNRSSTFEPHHIGSNYNLNFSNQPSQHEGRTSFFQPSQNEGGSSFFQPSQNEGGTSFFQPSHNEGGTSFFQPSVMESNASQTYQSLDLGQHGPSAMNGNSFNSSMMSNYETLNPYQPGPSEFPYEMQSFSNNENTAYNPEPLTNATTQPNLVLPQLENLNLYSDLGNTNEVSCDISNFLFDHNQMQANLYDEQQQGEGTNINFEQQYGEGNINFEQQYGEGANINFEQHYGEGTNTNFEIQQGEGTNINVEQQYGEGTNTNFEQQQGEGTNTNFELQQGEGTNTNFELQQGEGINTNFQLPTDFETELNQFLSLEDNADWNFVNTNQGYVNGETSNAFTTPEMNNLPAFNMNPNQNQEQYVPDFMGGSSSNLMELGDMEFMDSLFNNDMF